MIRHRCGVVGCRFLKDTPENGRIMPTVIRRCLEKLQHRGLEAAGIAVINETILSRKGLGTIPKALPPSSLDGVIGNPGLGHVRYSTTGDSNSQDAQPYTTDEVTLAHNGNLVNMVGIREMLEKAGTPLTTGCDAELILKTILMHGGIGRLHSALEHASQILEGGYSAILLSRDKKLIVIRDKLGIRPLCYTEGDGAFHCASESVALQPCQYGFRDVEPGGVIEVGGEVDAWSLRGGSHTHCMFEWVYFSHPASTLEGVSVSRAREGLGRELYRIYGGSLEGDIVIPVPDTARTAALSLAREAGLEYGEGLIKNRYLGHDRTFILPSRVRNDVVRKKFYVDRRVIEDRRVICVDDSIVRGTTTKEIVKLLRAHGAREVHLYITCPRLISPCFYGIDMATHQELVAAKHTVEEIAEILGADSVNYQAISGLKGAIGLEDLCLACLTGRYPTPSAQRMSDTLREMDVKRRYYEVDLA